AQKPPNGVSLVIRWPIVRTMRHPPAMVPSPIAACAERITQMGMWSALGRWNAWTGNATNSAELEARRATMIPIVFWASLVPCPREYSAAETSCSTRNARSTRRGKERSEERRGGTESREREGHAHSEAVRWGEEAGEADA